MFVVKRAPGQGIRIGADNTLIIKAFNRASGLALLDVDMASPQAITSIREENGTTRTAVSPGLQAPPSGEHEPGIYLRRGQILELGLPECADTVSVKIIGFVGKSRIKLGFERTLHGTAIDRLEIHETPGTQTPAIAPPDNQTGA